MRAFFTTILLALMAYALGFLIFVAWLPAAPERAPRADGIVVLTGGEERLDTAVALLERGVGKRLLVSGVDMQTPKRVLARMAHGKARFECCADIGYAAQDTHGNAEEAAEWVREHRFGSLVIVTARYHMPRAEREFSTAMPGVKLTPWPVDPDRVDVDHWWRQPRTAALMQREYVKYLGSLATTAIARLDPV